MNLAKISINRPVFAWMLMASLIVFGLVSFRMLGVSQLPDVDFPVVNVGVSLTGASPEVMESDVVDILENALMGVQGIRDITSSSRYGSANITLEFDLDRSIDFALQEVQSKVSQAIKLLPKDTDPPVISKTNPEDQPIIWLGFWGKMSQRELMSYARDKVINQFQLVNGVGDVFFGGYLEPNVRIWIDGQKLSQYEISIDDVVAAIGREHIEIPAGNLQQGQKEYNLRVFGEAKSVEEVGKISISKRGGQVNYRPVFLKDIATVEMGLEDVRRSSRVMGETAVGIGVRKQRGTNAVAVAKAVKKKIEDIQKSLPENMHIGVNFDSTKYIEESIHDLEWELIVSVLLTGLVCWLFLGSWSSTFNVVLAIPTSLIGAMIALYFFNFTLNSFTFLGLILSVGIVVDDAIMVLENIVRHKEMGKTAKVASLDGTVQITFAALATTLSIIAIFLPVTFMKGVIGKFFFQFGITISIAVALSLLEALTLTPMRCSQFLDIPEEGKSKADKLMKWMAIKYKIALQYCLHRPWKVTLSALGIFILSFGLLPGMRKEFVPSQDQGVFLVRMQTPVGSSIPYTDEVMKKAEAVIQALPETKRYFSAIGGFSGSNQANTGMMFITLKDRKDRKRSQTEVITEVRGQLNKIKDLKPVVQDLSTGGFGGGRGFPIEFSVRGSEWDKLIEEAKKMKDKLATDKRFVDLDWNYDDGMPEIAIIPDRDKALALGVSIEDIGKAVSYLMGGEKVARFTENGRRIDMRVKLKDQYRGAPEDILKIRVRNNRGELVPLNQIVHIQNHASLVSITRQQRERAITVYSNVAPGASQADMVKSIEDLGKNMTPGYSLVFGGSSKTFAESFSGLNFALLLGILVAYMILASQFNSFIHPVTVLLALPFSLTGAWLALRLGGQSLNIYSMIGFILLMGLVKKNSIMLVDFTNQVRETKKLSVKEALTEACPIRLRPVVMTSIAIVMAAFPSVLGIGQGSETRVPMSLAVIGGVIVSTFFTLFVVPCAYLLLSKLERKSATVE